LGVVILAVFLWLLGLSVSSEKEEKVGERLLKLVAGVKNAVLAVDSKSAIT